MEALHGGMEAVAVQGNKMRRRARRDRCVLWVRTGRVGTTGVDRVEALDLVAQIAYVRGGSAGREHGDVGSVREGHGGRRDEEVAKDLRGGAEVATVRGDNRGRYVTRRRGVAAAMADAEAAHGERLVLSGSSGASDARGTCGTHWCGRARRARWLRAGRAGREGTPGCVAGGEGAWCVSPES